MSDKYPKLVDYSALIPYKVVGVVELIVSEKKMPFVEALEYIYKSELYKHLSNESTKIWHLSPHKLFDLLENEKTQGFFEFPDFV